MKALSVSKNRSKGFIALISVLILGAVGTAVAVSVLLLGLNSSRMGLAVEQSNKAKALANACAEHALNIITINPNYTGSMGLIIGIDSCLYTITNLGGQNRNIATSSTVGVITRKVSVNVSAINPKIVVSSWQEVAN